MRIRKRLLKVCSCGGLKVWLYGRGRAVISGGWLWQNQCAVCKSCDERIRVAPRIDFAFPSGEVYSEGPS